jgi:hypothetical protein
VETEAAGWRLAKKVRQTVGGSAAPPDAPQPEALS